MLDEVHVEGVIGQEGLLRRSPDAEEVVDGVVHDDQAAETKADGVALAGVAHCDFGKQHVQGLGYKEEQPLPPPDVALAPAGDFGGIRAAWAGSYTVRQTQVGQDATDEQPASTDDQTCTKQLADQAS